MKNSFIYSLALFICLQLGGGIMAQNNCEKRIEFEFIVNASPHEVYKAWTTTEGIKTFFAPDGKVELKKFGDYHIYFFPDAPEGSRGAEDEIVLAFEENKMFSFTWGFPPSLPDLRANQKTVVNIRFFPTEDGMTKVHFLQTGWGEGEDWQKGFEYFVQAWGNVVLARLRYRFNVGPVDWNNMPNFTEYQLAK
jgi:uncharacterized protein YndB with AHSA1/START domain